MKRSVLVVASFVLALALVVGLWFTTPSRAQNMQEAKRSAESYVGTWVYEGQKFIPNPHDPNGLFNGMCNIISRPGASPGHGILFREDPTLEAMPKGSVFKLVSRNPAKESEDWSDYLEVKLVK